MAKTKSVQVGDVVKSLLNKDFLYVVKAVRGAWVDVYLKDDPAMVFTKQRRGNFTKA